ncbi:ABC transporter permease subunit [Alphaproteobacteria bacterium]|jgi:NitT/TauT family transport system permease protein|nr:ABC transporter permease subunit [Alphaproteobacteria bacterium]
MSYSTTDQAKHVSVFRTLPVHLAIFAGLILLWEFVNLYGFEDRIQADMIAPRPTHIGLAMIDIFFIDKTVWHHLGSTFQKALLGASIGTVIGMGLAISATLSETFRKYIKPWIILMEATPRIAVGPIFVALLGFGLWSAVALAALVAFFGPFVNTFQGLMEIDEESEEMFRSLGASKFQTFWKLRFASALQLISAGWKLATASAFGGALVAEFIQASEGMGVLIAQYVIMITMDYAFAALLSVTIFGYILFKIMEYMDYHLIFWQNDLLMLKVSEKRRKKMGVSS